MCGVCRKKAALAAANAAATASAATTYVSPISSFKPAPKAKVSSNRVVAYGTKKK